MKSISPTPYPDVNVILNLLLSNAEQILGDKFVGMYLYGSLASGDFNPQTSDIDFLIVTTDPLPENKIAELEVMHHSIWNSGLKWALKLEGAYIPQEEIRRYSPNDLPRPTINEGKFYVGRFGSDWIIQRHIIRECGVALEGPDPRTMIDPVSPDDLRSAVIGILNEWWFPMPERPDWLQNHGCNYHGFAVITMCRALHALEHGTIISKPAALKWAQQKLGSHWQTLIDQAVSSQYGKKVDILNETLDFIRFTREQVSDGRAYAERY
jgi:hypothetical protein